MENMDGHEIDCRISFTHCQTLRTAQAIVFQLRVIISATHASFTTGFARFESVSG